MQPGKRQHRSRQEWHAIIEHHKESGQSAAQFCKQEKIAYASFCNWKRRLQSDVSGVDDTPVQCPAEFIDLDLLSQSHNSGWRITLKLGNGVELELSQR